MARALLVYAVSDPQGSSTHPTIAAAVKEARATVARLRASGDDEAADAIEVQRITIPGPFNRALVCRLLSLGGYASDVTTVWRGGRAVDEGGQ